MATLNNKAVIITGGGSGIGAGTAAWLVQRGARVTICGRRADKLAAVAADLGDACLAVPGDVTRAEDRQRIVTTSLERWGRLDALVNNAGNMYRGPLQSLDEGALLDLFHGNVVAGMLMAGLCLDALSQAQGAIVYLGSIHNRRAFPGVSPYAATKGAVEAVTRSLAAELGPRGVRVNCVAPGAVFTEINQRAGFLDDAQARARLEAMSDLHALGRIGRVEEVAEAIGYFITAPWTTGTVLEVDGGLALGITRA